MSLSIGHRELRCLGHFGDAVERQTDVIVDPLHRIRVRRQVAQQARLPSSRHGSALLTTPSARQASLYFS
jgi:hypothetical protein